LTHFSLGKLIFLPKVILTKKLPVFICLMLVVSKIHTVYLRLFSAALMEYHRLGNF
jgi:hypothetical protein